MLPVNTNFVMVIKWLNVSVAIIVLQIKMGDKTDI